MQTALKRRRTETIGDQIRKIVLDEISSGRFAVGAKLPTERELADRFGVSLAPLRAALNDLTKAGIIDRVQGKGTFVRDAAVPQIRPGVLRSFTDNLRALGQPFTVTVLNCGLETPPPEIGAQIKVGKRDAFRIRRLFAIKERPAACIDAWFSPATFKGLQIRHQLEAGASAYRLAKEDAGIAFERLGGTIFVESGSEDVLDLLDLPFGSPIARVVMVSADGDNKLFEHSTLYCDAKRFVFDIPGK